MSYSTRTVDLELDDLLAIAPAVALDGPKGVGKTATASRRASTVWLLDDADHRASVQADRALSGRPARSCSTSGSDCRRSGTPYVVRSMPARRRGGS